MSEPRATGGCHCGAVRYEVDGPLRGVVICHCGRCLRTHGHVAAYSACERARLRMVSDAELRWYVADGRERGFCGRCGASLFWSAPDRPTISIAAGTLDRPTGLRTIAQIYAADASDYYEICGPGTVHPGPLPADGVSP
jgi:hypothetical protein